MSGFVKFDTIFYLSFKNNNHTIQGQTQMCGQHEDLIETENECDFNETNDFSIVCMSYNLSFIYDDCVKSFVMYVICLCVYVDKVVKFAVFIVQFVHDRCNDVIHFRFRQIFVMRIENNFFLLQKMFAGMIQNWKTSQKND